MQRGKLYLGLEEVTCLFDLGEQETPHELTLVLT